MLLHLFNITFVFMHQVTPKKSVGHLIHNYKNDIHSKGYRINHTLFICQWIMSFWHLSSKYMQSWNEWNWTKN